VVVGKLRWSCCVALVGADTGVAEKDTF
jgi:hypothetical protein